MATRRTAQDDDNMSESQHPSPEPNAEAERQFTEAASGYSSSTEVYYEPERSSYSPITQQGSNSDSSSTTPLPPSTETSPSRQVQTEEDRSSVLLVGSSGARTQATDIAATTSQGTAPALRGNTARHFAKPKSGYNVTQKAPYPEKDLSRRFVHRKLAALDDQEVENEEGDEERRKWKATPQHNTTQVPPTSLALWRVSKGKGEEEGMIFMAEEVPRLHAAICPVKADPLHFAHRIAYFVQGVKHLRLPLREVVKLCLVGAILYLERLLQRDQTETFKLPHMAGQLEVKEEGQKAEEVRPHLERPPKDPQRDGRSRFQRSVETEEHWDTTEGTRRSSHGLEPSKKECTAKSPSQAGTPSPRRRKGVPRKRRSTREAGKRSGESQISPACPS
ncbi:hypothetical protein MTO96_003953 [Rhipicephalus appendiculatus]